MSSEIDNIKQQSEIIDKFKNQISEDFKEIKKLSEELQAVFKKLEDDYKNLSTKTQSWTEEIRQAMQNELYNDAEKSLKEVRKLFSNSFADILRGDTKKFQKDMIKEIEKFRDNALKSVVKTLFLGNYGNTGQVGGFIGHFMSQSIKDKFPYKTASEKIDMKFLERLQYDLFHFSSSNKRAIGGSVNKGSPYLVGENGPELFIPDNYGSIKPDAAIATNLNITMNIKSDDYESFNKNKQQVVKEITKALNKHMRKY